jgi:TP901 family phage tail tape measure protein
MSVGAVSAAGVRAGKAFIEIHALDKTQRVLNTISARFKVWGQNLINTGQTLVTQSLTTLLPAAVGLKTYTDFDDIMRRAGARANASAAFYKKMQEQVKLLGRTTAFTAMEVATLQESLAQLGVKGEPLLAVTPSVLAMARAGGTGNKMADVQEASKAIVTTMDAYKMGLKDIPMIADVVSAAVNDSQSTLAEFNIAMQDARPIAKRTGVSFQELVAVMMTLRNTGIDAMRAGTAIRNMIIRPSGEGNIEKFNATLKELTGNTVKFADAADNLRPIPELMADISSKMKGLGNRPQTRLFNELFGLRAISPALSLSDMDDVFQQKYQTVMAATNDKGYAERLMAAMEGGPGGAKRLFLSALEGMLIELGNLLDDALIPFVKHLADLMNRFTEWMQMNKEVIVTIIALSAISAAFGITLVLVGITLKVIGVYIGMVAMAFVALKAIVVLMFAKWVALARAVLMLSWHFGDLKAIIARLKKDFKDFFRTLWNDAKFTFDKIIGALSSGQFELAGKIAMKGLELSFMTAFEKIRVMFEEWKDGIVVGITDIKNAAKDMYDYYVNTPVKLLTEKGVGLYRQTSNMLEGVTDITGPAVKETLYALWALSGMPGGIGRGGLNPGSDNGKGFLETIKEKAAKYDKQDLLIRKESLAVQQKIAQEYYDRQKNRNWETASMRAQLYKNTRLYESERRLAKIRKEILDLTKQINNEAKEDAFDLLKWSEKASRDQENLGAPPPAINALLGKPTSTVEDLEKGTAAAYRQAIENTKSTTILINILNKVTDIADGMNDSVDFDTMAAEGLA